MDKMDFHSFVSFVASVEDVELVRMDPLDLIYDTKQPFDLLLHKVTDEIVAFEQKGDSKMGELVDKMDRFLNQHPEIENIDPINDQRKVLDRSVTGDLLSQIEKELPKELSIRMPKQYTINTNDDLQVDIRYPIVCKTTLACGTADSHKMGIVFNTEGLSQFKFPYLIQEFYNHNATIFKVFVVGEKIHIEKRKSLPNLNRELKENIYFDSQLPLGPQLEKFSSPTEETDMKEPPMETIVLLTKSLRKHMNLSLLGFDMITERETGYHAIIDVNYFPSYKGFPDFNKVLLDYLLSRIRK
eukprot:TRINITY_DN1469_c0_g1_i2.p1 TRINITY_DN1469_c0_g1~~TRINITY_DN1469_c0_g1_i2.p1  ORF type:complete len:318 (+),score=87.92 TRINITY_DN1469_c0_g1_i2:59-955(+)